MYFFMKNMYTAVLFCFSHCFFFKFLHSQKVLLIELFPFSVVFLFSLLYKRSDTVWIIFSWLWDIYLLVLIATFYFIFQCNFVIGGSVLCHLSAYLSVSCAKMWWLLKKKKSGTCFLEHFTSWNKHENKIRYSKHVKGFAIMQIMHSQADWDSI